MTLKKLQKYKDSETEYKSLQKTLRLTEGKQLVKYIFSLTLLPLQNDRKVTIVY